MVLDRNKETGSVGEPVYLDVVTALNQAGRGDIRVVGGRYGLSSKDTTPGQLIAVYDNLRQEIPKNSFTIGICDDVTHTSLDYENVEFPHPGEISCKIWGLGGDGTVGANKNAISTIGLVANKYAQAYFSYDSMKSGGLTQSHLRFSDEPIHATYLVQSADFVAVHNAAYLEKFDVARELKQGGTFLLNCRWSANELDEKLPTSLKRRLAEKNAHFYTIDASDIALKLGLGNRTNTVLQAAFFQLADIIPMDVAVKAMKDAINKTYLVKAGQKVVDMNCAAVDEGVSALHKVEIPESWKDAKDAAVAESKPADFLHDLIEPMNQLEGDKLPVSLFQKYGTVDGTWPSGTSVYDKRTDAVLLPKWDAGKCVQCNQCSMVCPHAAIRAFLLTDEEEAAAPETFETVKARGAGLDKYRYRIQVSPYDCLGCGQCVTSCLAKDTALTMVSAETMMADRSNWDYAVDHVSIKEDAVNKKNIKGLQFARHYYQFPPACAGCGETAYVKMVTQLFGDHMYISNATGCSSIWGGPAATSPYCTNKAGHGPAWCNSLFEDNAEHGLGMFTGQNKIREDLADETRQLIAVEWARPELKAAAQAWLDTMNDGTANAEPAKAYVKALEESITTVEELAAIPQFAEHAAELKAKGALLCDCAACTLAADILSKKEYLAKKSMWIFGGDGWAYDIGYGGLDHVIASKQDVNIFVFDTEVYSNTGGQASKASNIGQVAQFAAAGKEVKKKSLSEIAMQYGYVYVAQVAMGANPAQTIKAITEAEAYHGPSLIIGYSPCEMHSIKGGMMNCQKEMKKAVDCGYWNLFRYNPDGGDKKFTLDSKAPAGGYQEFLMNEARYSRLTREFPERADVLFKRNEDEAKARYEHLLKLIEMYDK